MNVCKKGLIALYPKPKVYSTSDYPKKYELTTWHCANHNFNEGLKAKSALFHWWRRLLF
jgi:hypothetical protein